MPKIRNIIIFIVIGATFGLIYWFFIKPAPEDANLVSTPATSLPDVNSTFTTEMDNTSETSLVARDFLSLLLNVKNIKLNDAIFADPAFALLHDSSIVLTPDGTEGRPNPFAQFGNDGIVPPPANPANNTPATPTTPSSPSSGTPVKP